MWKNTTCEEITAQFFLIDKSEDNYLHVRDKTFQILLFSSEKNETFLTIFVMI